MTYVRLNNIVNIFNTKLFIVIIIGKNMIIEYIKFFENELLFIFFNIFSYNPIINK